MADVLQVVDFCFNCVSWIREGIGGMKMVADELSSLSEHVEGINNHVLLCSLLEADPTFWGARRSGQTSYSRSS